MGGSPRCFEDLRSAEGGLAWGSGTAGCSWRFAVLCRKNRNGVCCPVGKSLCRERDKKFICGTQGICRYSGYAVKAIWHGG